MDHLDKRHFSVIDYTCFVIVLLFSAIIGFYHGARSKKSPSSKEDYLLGGRSMSVVPVICSLVATSASGMTIVGLSAEAYAYGIHSWMLCVSLLVGNFAFIQVFFPVLRELKVASSFEYLEMRFNRSVRIFASGIYTLAVLIQVPVTVYIPALVFQNVTGIHVYATVTALSILCASYTAIGGFRAVVWTDVFQLTLMALSCCIIATVGVTAVGGIENVWNAAERGGRLNWINLTNVSSRTTIWTYFNGAIIAIYQFGLNQANVQRYLSLSTMKEVKAASWIVTVLFGAFICLSQLMGAIMYTSYETCDPLRRGFITAMDQILPYFVRDKASFLTGFNGIFIAGIFAAGLSTTSSFLNALGGSIYEDFLSYRLVSISESTAKNIMRAIVLILGVIQVPMVFAIEKMGMLFQIQMQVMSVATCTLFGFFTVGILCPKINGKGAKAGACAGGIVIAILIVGGMSNKTEPPLPLRTDGCGSQFNSTELTSANVLNNSQDTESEDVFWLFKIPFVYYSLIGLVINLLTSYIVSLLTGGNTVEDQGLLAPFLRDKTIKTNEELELQQKKLLLIEKS
ncbi:sodium-coupled monocarboxylate transporter 1-like [Phlebotomus papatasi]|uniref:sodium-coupled monocarboxylate transporter 1-like n=1 Tax=Phlebotomus papatasi TaxID=29031 RepID=UPI002484722C|nr:sodium-coupled monocarboxylate transporter 1-like [Phlebotomus papatasi]